MYVSIYSTITLRHIPTPPRTIRNKKGNAIHAFKQNRRTLLHRLILQKLLEAKRFKRHTVTNEMLAHSLDPVQTQRMQHGTRTLHDTQYGNRKREPEVKDKHHDEGAAHTRKGKGVLHGHFPEHNRETLMGEREGPETEIRRRVGNAVEAEF
jgi:hypothetical protein